MLSARHSKMSPICARAQVARQQLVEQRDRIALGAELKRLALADLDHTLVPAIGAHHRLVDRQRIEELVGEHDQRTVRHLLDRAMPRHRHVGEAQRLALQALQRRADFDHVQGDGGAEARHHLCDPQNVAHHGAATRPELHQVEAARRSHCPPHGGRPQPHQFAEHLADLRRGDEIAPRAERIPGGVIAALGMGQAKFHIWRHRDRTAALDAPANFHLERDTPVRHHVDLAGWRRMAAHMMARPASINGSDSSVPMVRPPHRNPSCASGSRNCSQIERATP